MNFPIPGFIPVPAAETMRLISIILLIAGVCITVTGVLFLLASKRRGKGRNTLAWIWICAGALLTVNHVLQLIF